MFASIFVLFDNPLLYRLLKEIEITVLKFLFQNGQILSEKREIIFIENTSLYYTSYNVSYQII